MRYLFIMGASGCGKTTLAKTLETLNSKRFSRVVQYTTRAPREGETDGNEYFYINDSDYDYYDKDNRMLAQVQEEFLPARYGTDRNFLKKTKINIIVASIEGLLDAVNKIPSKDKIHILFIDNVKPEVERENRDYVMEEKYNKIVLHNLEKIHKRINYVEIDHSLLKTIRNNKQAIFTYLALNNII